MIKVQTSKYITKYFCLRFKDIFVMLIDSKKCSLSKLEFNLLAQTMNQPHNMKEK